MITPHALYKATCERECKYTYGVQTQITLRPHGMLRIKHNEKILSGNDIGRTRNLRNNKVGLTFKPMRARIEKSFLALIDYNF